MKIMAPQATPIGHSGLSYEVRNGRYQYWYYTLPYGYHDEDDIGGRNLKIASFGEDGIDDMDLAAAFKIDVRHVRRLRRTLRTRGWKVFTDPPKRRGPSAMDEEQKAAAERLLAEGASIRQAAKDIGVVHETLRRYVRKGLVEAAPPGASAEAAEGAVEESSAEKVASPLDRFSREVLDRAARMGRGARNMIDRVKASNGTLKAVMPRFVRPRMGVRNAGLMTAFVAMKKLGILDDVEEHLPIPNGYYSGKLIVMAQTSFHLLRKTAAQVLKHGTPAELGAAFGIDRLPCIETFREKIKALSKDLSRVKGWCNEMSRRWWREFDGDLDRVINLDKHYKICSTRRARIPRLFLNSKKCCLPALARLWANLLGGVPLFCVCLELNKSLCRCIREHVVPKLRDELGILPPDAPNLHLRRVEARKAVEAARSVANPKERKAAKRAATKARAEADAARPALTMVFDREAWSPNLFRWLAEFGIAIICWCKGDAGPDWPESEFRKMSVPISGPFGFICRREYRVAERRVVLYAADKKAARNYKGERKAKANARDARPNEEDFVEVREIRRLRDDGHQAKFVATDSASIWRGSRGRCFRAGRRRTSSNTRSGSSIWGD